MRIIGDLAGADRIMNEAIFVGVYPGLTRAMLVYIFARAAAPDIRFALGARVPNSHSVTLLQQRDHQRHEARLLLWEETRRSLAVALRELLPGTRVWLYGSLTRRGVFNPASDVDLALTEEPCGKTIWRLQAELEDSLRRPIDLVLLYETRLRDKILREGEEWMT